MKTPIIQNGNNTYRLTHTRYMGPPNTEIIFSANSSGPLKAATPPQIITNSPISGVIPVN